VGERSAPPRSKTPNRTKEISPEGNYMISPNLSELNISELIRVITIIFAIAGLFVIAIEGFLALLFPLS
jgi:hypothetical protein